MKKNMQSPEISNNAILCRQLLLGWLALAYMLSFSALCLEIHKDAVKSGSLVFIIDNLKYLIHG